MLQAFNGRQPDLSCLPSRAYSLLQAIQLAGTTSVVSGTFTDDFFGRGITGFSLETVEQTGKLMIAPLRYGQNESQSLSVGPRRIAWSGHRNLDVPAD